MTVNSNASSNLPAKSVKRHLLKSPSNSWVDFLQFSNPCSFPWSLAALPLVCHTFVHSHCSPAGDKPGKPLGKSLATMVVGETIAGCSLGCRWCCRTDAPGDFEEMQYSSWCLWNAGQHRHVMADKENTNFGYIECLLGKIQITANVLGVFQCFICVQG